MPGRARKLIITERQQAILQTMTRSGTCPQAVAQRARIILMAFDGHTNQDIAEHLGWERHAIGPWRHRWADAFERLVLTECCEKPSALPRAIEELLSDRPRPGCPGKFTAEQVTQILAVACEEPEAVRPTRDALDATGVGRRGRQARHRRVDLAPPGGALLKVGPNSGPTAAATGSMREPDDPEAFRARSRRSATATERPRDAWSPKGSTR